MKIKIKKQGGKKKEEEGGTCIRSCRGREWHEIFEYSFFPSSSDH